MRPIPRLLTALALALVLIPFWGCKPRHTYSQATPDDVVKSAVEMVKNNEANRLSDLVFAESAHMRAVLDRLGVFLGHLQQLAGAIQERFPEEVARRKAEAQLAASDPNSKAGGLLSRVLSGGSSQGGIQVQRSGGDRGRRGINISVNAGPGGINAAAGPADRSQGVSEDELKNLVADLFADPYSWIDQNTPRLATIKIADDLATVTLDNEIILPPVGIPLKEDGGRWYVALPTHLPPLSKYMPRTKAEWDIIASTIHVLDNTVLELTDDVRSGRLASLKSIADDAGRKTLMPIMFAGASYMKVMDIREKRESLGKQFSKRKADWLDARRAESGARGHDDAMPDLLAATIDDLAPKSLDRLATRDKRPKISEMTDASFAEFLEGLLAEEGLKVSLSLPLQGPRVDAAIEAWERSRPRGTVANARK
ncbi:MAG: hypothetical protein KF745_10785 [Phycisphaeraceae bacterium]|nr:hypothetical protein [Phycisphaeraceae bacterium]